MRELNTHELFNAQKIPTFLSFLQRPFQCVSRTNGELSLNIISQKKLIVKAILKKCLIESCRVCLDFMVCYYCWRCVLNSNLKFRSQTTYGLNTTLFCVIVNAKFSFHAIFVAHVFCLCLQIPRSRHTTQTQHPFSGWQAVIVNACNWVCT